MDNNENKETIEVVEEVNAPAKEKKGKGKLIGILIAIIVLLAGTTCYFAFVRDNDKDKKDNKKSSDTKNNNTKDDNTDPNNTKDDNNTTTTKEATSDEISAIMKKFDKYYLMELIYGTDATFTKDKINDLQLNMLGTYMSAKYSDAWQEAYENNAEVSFSKSDADTYFQELYGFKPNTYRDVICSNDEEAFWYYKGDKFVHNDDHPGHGGYTTSYLDYYVSDSKVEGNTYTITLNLLYGHEEMGYYINGVSIDDKVDVEYSDDDYDKVYAEYKSYFNKHKDEYKKRAYKFTFEKKNGEYYLKSYSK